VAKQRANLTLKLPSFDSNSSNMYHIDIDFRFVHGPDTTTNTDKRTYDLEQRPAQLMPKSSCRFSRDYRAHKQCGKEVTLEKKEAFCVRPPKHQWGAGKNHGWVRMFISKSEESRMISLCHGFKPPHASTPRFQNLAHRIPTAPTASQPIHRPL
jgi:hypothetical protein